MLLHCVTVLSLTCGFVFKCIGLYDTWFSLLTLSFFTGNTHFPLLFLNNQIMMYFNNTGNLTYPVINTPGFVFKLHAESYAHFLL